MNHKFTSSRLDTLNCATCSRIESEHGITDCESCGKNTDCELVGSILMCKSCADREKLTPASIPTVAVLTPEEKLDSLVRHVAELMRKLDGEIPLRSREDIFNAETVDLQTIKQRIESDEKIEDKVYAYGKAVENRISKLRAIIMSHGQGRMGAVARAEACQVSLNETVVKMKLEQRAQFKESDLRYKSPEPVKPKKSSKIPSTNKVVQSVYNAIYAKAVEAGKISQEQAIKLAEQQVANMLQGAGTKK